MNESREVSKAAEHKLQWGEILEHPECELLLGDEPKDEISTRLTVALRDLGAKRIEEIWIPDFEIDHCHIRGEQFLVTWEAYIGYRVRGSKLAVDAIKGKLGFGHGL